MLISYYSHLHVLMYMCHLHEFISSTIASSSSVYQPALHVALTSLAELDTFQALHLTASLRGAGNARKTLNNAGAKIVWTVIRI